jgi:small-conductance mechanosensitive channel
MNIAVEEQKAGNIDPESLQIIKSDICSLLKYYEIPSKLCGTAVNEKLPVEQPSSIGSKIVKIILIVLAIVFVLFIILVIVFVIKAKKKREQQSQE